ncbi:hypothetical protein [Agarivorans sp. Z349TD_8]|uniref:hypothetical protein n=1 Tax=Agarivorans sp. Z349TD_8 TaxID=3421434 RepID=UPI003D7CBAAA
MKAHRIKIARFITAIILLTPMMSWAGQALVHVPGTTVSMTPPAGFTLSNSFSGFENLTTHSSIVIAELPGDAYAQLQILFTDAAIAKKGFATKGIQISKRQNIKVGANSIPLLSGNQHINGINVVKYISLLDGNSSVLINYNLLNQEQLSENDVIKSLQSISLSAAEPLETKLQNLPFKFTAFSPFKVVDVLLGSSAILTTFDGSDPSGNLPIMVLASSQAQHNIGDIKPAAEQFLKSTTGFQDARITNAQPVKFANLDGYKIQATAGDKTIVQYLAMKEDGSYLRLVSTGATQKITELVNAIQLVADSMTLTP